MNGELDYCANFRLTKDERKVLFDEGKSDFLYYTHDFRAYPVKEELGVLDLSQIEATDETFEIYDACRHCGFRKDRKYRTTNQGNFEEIK